MTGFYNPDESVYCAVRTGALNSIHMTLSLYIMDAGYFGTNKALNLLVLYTSLKFKVVNVILSVI